MKKIGIIICARYQDCGGGKCFRALRERHGGFSLYGPDEEVEIVGYANCGGCPGGNIEHVPAEFLKNGCDVVHLATGLVVGRTNDWTSPAQPSLFAPTSNRFPT